MSNTKDILANIPISNIYNDLEQNLRNARTSVGCLMLAAVKNHNEDQEGRATDLLGRINDLITAAHHAHNDWRKSL